MTGFEPRTSGVGSDPFTNWATTTAQIRNSLSGLVKRGVSRTVILTPKVRVVWLNDSKLEH